MDAVRWLISLKFMSRATSGVISTPETVIVASDHVGIRWSLYHSVGVTLVVREELEGRTGCEALGSRSATALSSKIV
jgi:hypothetical protein